MGGDLGRGFLLLFGSEVERTSNDIRGTIPVREDVLDPNADVFTLDEVWSATRTGGYSEIEFRPVQGGGGTYCASGSLLVKDHEKGLFRDIRTLLLQGFIEE